MNIAKALTVTVVCASLLCAPLVDASQGNTFDRVRYNGGTIANHVDPKDWSNKLTVTSDAIVFTFKDKQVVTIDPKSVTALSYGQEAHRRVGTMIALAILIAPVALFGLMHKTRLHYIGIEFNTADGKHAGMLLQGDKDNYRAILVALQSVSGVAVAVSDKDREFLPVGVTTSVVKQTEAAQKTDEKSPSPPSKEARTGSVSVVSNPNGADVYVDGKFVGNSPAELKLILGNHVISAKMTGFKDWEREIDVSDGAVSLTATLVSNADQTSAITKPTEKQATRDASTPAMPANTNSASTEGWIGITSQDDGGRIVVMGVAANGPAEQAGLRVGDVLIAVNDIPMKSGDGFGDAIRSCKPGSTVKISYMRNAWQSDASVTLGRQ